MPKLISHKRRKKIIAAIKEGNKTEWIKATFKCSTMTVTRYRRELGIVGRFKPKLDEELKAAIMQGKSYSQIRKSLFVCNRKITEARRGLIGITKKVNQYNFYK